MIQQGLLLRCHVLSTDKAMRPTLSVAVIQTSVGLARTRRSEEDDSVNACGKSVMEFLPAGGEFRVVGCSSHALLVEPCPIWIYDP